MKITFEIKIGVADHNNNIIMPGALKIKGKSIPLLKDGIFHLDNVAGTCTITSHSDSVVIVDAESDLLLGNLTAYPCLLIKKSEMKDGVRIIHDARLLYMGISATPAFKTP